jgi:hypothetical protein
MTVLSLAVNQRFLSLDHPQPVAHRALSLDRMQSDALMPNVSSLYAANRRGMKREHSRFRDLHCGATSATMGTVAQAMHSVCGPPALLVDLLPILRTKAL